MKVSARGSSHGKQHLASRRSEVRNAGSRTQQIRSFSSQPPLRTQFKSLASCSISRPGPSSSSFSSKPSLLSRSQSSSSQNTKIQWKEPHNYMKKFSSTSAKAPTSSSNPSSSQASELNELIGQELEDLNAHIRQLVSSEHPLLAKVAQYYFSLKGKRFRPVLVLLISRALDCVPNDQKVSLRQFRLAEIIEMIHTASIIHDDIIDEASTRRGNTSIGSMFGNKMAILAGDFLLAQASIALSKLQNHEVTRLISVTIGDLVEGEFLQMKPTTGQNKQNMDIYLRKTYLKTASLIANSCRSAALLTPEPCSPEKVDLAFEFGKEFGIAFQLIDDLLDFTGSDDSLGKPAAADLKLGLSTAPVLFAVEEYPQLLTLAERSFRNPGDVEEAQSLVRKSQGLHLTKQLAADHMKRAIDHLMRLGPSPARELLLVMSNSVLSRTH